MTDSASPDPAKANYGPSPIALSANEVASFRACQEFIIRRCLASLGIPLHLVGEIELRPAPLSAITPLLLPAPTKTDGEKT